MCLGLPAKVLSIDGNNSTVEMMGVSNTISIELLENVKAGDYVLVHAGCAIQILDQEEALKTIEIFEDIKRLGGSK
ncbi:hydrogenase expression/formation protein HypC [Ruminiclostridium sufflavum DSM 19573]|uniref:Hydrogenase expression/formation protein HypC n=1 Tax=Ruminiclostridium sufflavum DSM 19573 TaxID=1121337 RepID=A0A318XZH2_9FIRM|nr:HypC/HybG/HupF family hydrogenase formation chaperone [Ruminiclostridium sufflavum]PYG88420.1 hydrogenase expression/formation protein HypC [Ruminiclostridium sufflavum DSM 19573]